MQLLLLNFMSGVCVMLCVCVCVMLCVLWWRVCEPVSILQLSTVVQWSPTQSNRRSVVCCVVPSSRRSSSSK